jgi:uncharacterized membrane protein YraQ (UPF0718 family)
MPEIEVFGVVLGMMLFGVFIAAIVAGAVKYSIGKGLNL